MQSENMRDAKRQYLFNYPKITQAENGLWLGYVGDLSTQGMLLISQHMLAVESTHQVVLHVPKNLQLAQATLKLQFQVRWVKPHVAHGQWCMGCEFSEISAEQQAMLWQIATETGFEENFGMQRIADNLSTS